MGTLLLRFEVMIGFSSLLGYHSDKWNQNHAFRIPAAGRLRQEDETFGAALLQSKVDASLGYMNETSAFKKKPKTVGRIVDESYTCENSEAKNM